MGAIAALATALLALPPVERLRPVSVDVLHALRASVAPAVPAAAAPVAIVAIDEETYRSPRFADTPQAMWTRDIARVVSALVEADVRVIGFDVVYPTSVDRFLPGFDRDFLLALRRGGQQDKIVLGKVQHQQHPIAPFAGQRLAVGGEDNIRSLNLVTDADEIVPPPCSSMARTGASRGWRWNSRSVRSASRRRPAAIACASATGACQAPAPTAS